MQISVRVDNTYNDGTITKHYTVDVPVADPDDVDEWSEDYIFPLTGTGRSDDYAGYETKVTACDEQPWLVGRVFCWGEV